ncbi:MAG: GAF domain-containing sensor histidine kinase [Candidatus Niyogibacteria bacterium]|nr:GAF domain-containing sensor histidine kinase [Candidatus Niyogibacteria bacterium]
MTNKQESRIENELLKLFEFLFPDSVLLSVRWLDSDHNALKLEFRWQKEERAGMPETDDEISLFRTVGGNAAIQKRPIYVPEIDKEPLFYPRGESYVTAGYVSMKAFPLFGFQEEVIGVAQVYTNIRFYNFTAKEERAIKIFCEMMERLILSRKLQEKTLETKLHEQSQRHAREIDHHIKNKITPIGGFNRRNINIIGRCEKEDRAPTPLEMAEIKRNSMIAVQSCDHMEDVMHDILRFGPSELKTESTDMATFLHPIINLIVESENIAIDRNFTESIPVNIDRLKMEMVIQELLRNAKKATEASGGHLPILCRLYRYNKNERNSICFEVENEGEIPSEIRDQIFDPFFTTDKKNGTGLGLSLAKLTLERHGGAILVQSAKGRTSARIYIPIAN